MVADSCLLGTDASFEVDNPRLPANNNGRGLGTGWNEMRGEQLRDNRSQDRGKWRLSERQSGTSLKVGGEISTRKTPVVSECEAPPVGGRFSSPAALVLLDTIPGRKAGKRAAVLKRVGEGAV
jgi:hypothetical protein